MRTTRWLLATLYVLAFCEVAGAQTTQAAPARQGWDVSVYPIFAWVPINISIDVDIPPSGGDGGGSGNILESRFDGAYFGGVSVSNGVWRFDGQAIWAAFGGDRPQLPFLKVDLDLIYGEARLGRRVARDLYLTAGLRRVALNYDITLGDLPNLSRKPGLWDPLIGIGWHRIKPKVEWHVTFDGGGFGVGADVDVSGAFRFDWKPWRHFGITAGYSGVYLKISDTPVNRTLIVKVFAHGPAFGIGLYF